MAINSRTSVNYNSFRQFDNEITNLIDDLKEHKDSMVEIIDELCTENWAGRDADEFRAKFEDNLFPFIETYLRNLNKILQETSSYYRAIEDASSSYR